VATCGARAVLLVSIIAALHPADASWIVQHEGTPHRLLTDVHFSDPLHGWCVGHVTQGQPAAILKTADGGQHWTQIDPGFVIDNGWGVHAVDSLNVWAAGGHGMPKSGVGCRNPAPSSSASMTSRDT